MSIRWDDRPPSDRPDRLGIQVFSLPPGGKEFVRLLGPWRGVWLHWVKPPGERGRTVPCLDDCPHCPDLRRRWTGYAPALLWKRDAAGDKMTWAPIVLPVGEDVAEQLRPLATRGLVLELRRRGKRANGLVEASVLERSIKDPLPPAFPVEPILIRMWSVRASGLAAAAGDQAGADEAPDVIPFRRPGADGEPRRDARRQ